MGTGGRRRGFTLIELLVVIAIIAILAAILFPVFARAKRSAQISRCVYNMKQWTMALQKYTDDNNGHYPWAGANGLCPHMMGVPPLAQNGSPVVIDALKKYVSNNEDIRWCPLWNASEYGRNPANKSLFRWSYWYYCPHNNPNVSAFPESALCGYTEGDVAAPSKKPCFSEYNLLHEPEGLQGPDWRTRKWSYTLAYCDGHVKLIVATYDTIVDLSYTGRNGRPATH